MRLIGVIVGVLIVAVSDGSQWSRSNYTLIATAAAAGNTGGQGVNGQPQKKSGTVKGPPKANPSISGSQTRGKR